MLKKIRKQQAKSVLFRELQDRAIKNGTDVIKEIIGLQDSVDNFNQLLPNLFLCLTKNEKEIIKKGLFLKQNFLRKTIRWAQNADENISDFNSDLLREFYKNSTLKNMLAIYDEDFCYQETVFLFLLRTLDIRQNDTSWKYYFEKHPKDFILLWLGRSNFAWYNDHFSNNAISIKEYTLKNQKEMFCFIMESLFTLGHCTATTDEFMLHYGYDFSVRDTINLFSFAPFYIDRNDPHVKNVLLFIQKGIYRLNHSHRTIDCESRHYDGINYSFIMV